MRHDSEWGAFALKWDDEILLSVWRFDSESDTISIPLFQGLENKLGGGSASFQGLELSVETVYPQARTVSNVWKKDEGILEITLPEPRMARMFRVSRV